MPNFTTDWFNGHIAQWKLQLRPLLDQHTVFRALEVGSYEGRSACWLANHLAPQVNLECIDPFPNAQVEARFMENTKMFRDRGQISVSKGYSMQELSRRVADGCEYDFIYVDGSHEAAAVLFDAVLAFKLVRIGGKICFDDYQWKKQHRKLPPKPAIDSFLHCYAPFLTVTWKKYQVWIQKTQEAMTT